MWVTSCFLLFNAVLIEYCDCYGTRTKLAAMTDRFTVLNHSRTAKTVTESDEDCKPIWVN